MRLTPETRGIVTLADLLRMKPTALFVNVARAALIEPGALVAALEQGQPGFAAVDVYDQKPIIGGNHPLLKMPNVLCTPHLGWAEWDTFELYFRECFEQIVNYADRQLHGGKAAAAGELGRRNSNLALGVRRGTEHHRNTVMKTLLTATAAIALFAAAGSASAQMYEPMNPAVTPSTTTTYQTYQTQTYRPMQSDQMQGYQMMQGPVQPMQQPTYTSGAMVTPSWMQDDGSSSDYPIHNPGDRSGDPLNAQYQGGFPTAPGHGFPAYPGEE